MELTKDILNAACNGFKVPSSTSELDYGLDWEKLESNRIAEYITSLFDSGINPMFEKLGLDTHKISISVKLLDKINFAYASYLYEFKDGCDFNGEVSGFDLIDLKKNAIETYSNRMGEKEIDCCVATAMILESSGSIIGQAIASNLIIINKSAAIKTLGLHLICHEIMHLLANKEAVKSMRGGAMNMNMNDEAVNEYFARLATYFYINSDTVGQEERRKIAGLTCFSNELFKGHEQHDSNLGLYGRLMAKDAYMKNKEWNNMDDVECVKYIKKLAQFYFLGGRDPLKAAQEKD